MSLPCLCIMQMECRASKPHPRTISPHFFAYDFALSLQNALRIPIGRPRETMARSDFAMTATLLLTLWLPRGKISFLIASCPTSVLHHCHCKLCSHFFKDDGAPLMTAVFGQI